MFRHNTKLRATYPWCHNLNSHACQASVERATRSIDKFYADLKNPSVKKKSYPQFKKHSRSVEYKQSGWKITQDRKRLTITDKTGIGSFRLVGSRDLHFYQLEQIKRMRLIRRADGYYAQFSIQVDRNETRDKTGTAECSDCGARVKKSLSTRTHVCECGCELDRDTNASINILNRGLNTLGRRELEERPRVAARRKGTRSDKAYGDETSMLSNASLAG